MRSRSLYLIIIFFLVLSCSKNQITLPPDNPNTNLINTLTISDSVLKPMEGIYTVIDGSNSLGSQYVCKTSLHKVSFFSNVQGIFIILDFGFHPADSSIQFSGFWRYSENTKQGLINFSISLAGGSADLLIRGIVTNLKLQANFNDANGSASAMTLSYTRPFSDYAKAHPFQIYGHHGVETTANPPYAENSLEGVLHDEAYGLNGLEFDVHLTKDGIPICVHDPSINPRINQKGPLSGNFIQYSFSFLTEYIRLIDGQKIPSVEQVLNDFIDSTTMQYLWLDVKGDPGIFKYLEPVVRAAYARAASKNRTVEIIADLPSQKVIDEYHAQPSYATLPSMCELSLQDAIDNKCQYYSPRYTQGLVLDDVNKAHGLGMKVLSWTLNDKTIIQNYLVNGKFDGFISDYPAYVVYDFYTLY